MPDLATSLDIEGNFYNNAHEFTCCIEVKHRVPDNKALVYTLRCRITYILTYEYKMDSQTSLSSFLCYLIVNEPLVTLGGLSVHPHNTSVTKYKPRKNLNGINSMYALNLQM